MTQNGYQGGFYQNPNPGDDFAGPYCQSGRNAYALLWSDQPSQSSSTTRSGAPAFNPTKPPCLNQTLVWQYKLNAAESGVLVDQDEALPSAPLWHP